MLLNDRIINDTAMVSTLLIVDWGGCLVFTTRKYNIFIWNIIFVILNQARQCVTVEYYFLELGTWCMGLKFNLWLSCKT